MRARRVLASISPGGALAPGASAVPAQAADPYVVHGTYSTRATCVDVGSTGEFHGPWLAWNCTRVVNGYQLWAK
ncbi:hypothetical protein GCM10018771_64540 [Streptomyces cellulosae]|nr:hypothetical protein GCM10018771_64540 [Streptomyces cellulosae]